MTGDLANIEHRDLAMMNGWLKLRHYIYTLLNFIDNLDIRGTDGVWLIKSVLMQVVPVE
jgi:hypothetical protein